MAARAIWKGALQFEQEQLPVRLYSAVEDRAVHFHLLHDQDQVRLKRRLVDPQTEETVELNEVRRGLEVDRNQFVVLPQEELDALRPEGTRNIQLLCFLDPTMINHQWYDRPYYLGPDGNAESYFAFATALEQSAREGLVKWAMRGKEYLGALQAQDGYLQLITLHYADEVVDTAEIPPPTGRALDRRERAMAEQLVSALETTFQPENYHDEYRDAVLALIASKQRGEPVPVAEVRSKQPSDSLTDALQASLQHVGR